MYPYRQDVIKHIKKSLRGKKDTWHVISFNYSGYHVAAKCHETWAQRVTATELDSCGGQSVVLRDGSNMGLTQKACVEFFESFLNCLDEIRSEERSK
tara:strand:- start:260 stop:550 length:291 start_codon:yes stop_codon:yes gene_type:complete